MNRVFVTGQCTLHWGRLEFGNIGNYYVAEPLFRELRRVFPDAEIRTTFQMSDEFCSREGVTRAPMEMYYSWTDEDLPLARRELAIAEEFSETGKASTRTPFIDEVLGCDLFVDFSGDIWGDNADLVGPDRFLVGLLKDRVAQLLGRKTAMIAGSPGPFESQELKSFAREVYNGFDLVTNREFFSAKLMQQEGFNVSKTQSFACPAFLFEPANDDEMELVLEREGLFQNGKKKVGFVLCGWNMLEGPYTKWPREDSEYLNFVQLAEHILGATDADIYFMSHSNGFELPPEFELIHGRDFPFAKQMHEIMVAKGHGERVHLIEGLYSPAETKGILRQLDALVSGRVHAAVGALAQHVPTLIIDYGHEPKAHKLKGFAEVADVLEYVVDPAFPEDMLTAFSKLWDEQDDVRSKLESRITVVQKWSRENFNQLLKLVEC